MTSNVDRMEEGVGKTRRMWERGTRSQYGYVYVEYREWTHALNKVLMELVSSSETPDSEDMHPWHESSWATWEELGQMQEMTPESVRSGHSVARCEGG